MIFSEFDIFLMTFYFSLLMLSSTSSVTICLTSRLILGNMEHIPSGEVALSTLLQRKGGTFASFVIGVGGQCLMTMPLSFDI